MSVSVALLAAASLGASAVFVAAASSKTPSVPLSAAFWVKHLSLARYSAEEAE